MLEIFSRLWGDQLVISFVYHNLVTFTDRIHFVHKLIKLCHLTRTENIRCTFFWKAIFFVTFKLNIKLEFLI